MTQVTDTDLKVARNFVDAVHQPNRHKEAAEIIACHRTASTAALEAEVKQIKEGMEAQSRTWARMSLEKDHLAAALTAENQRLREEATGALADYDATVKACPANMQFLGDKLCPKCNAGPDEGCRREIIASGDVIRRVRAALSTTSEVSEPVADESGGEAEPFRDDSGMVISRAELIADFKAWTDPFWQRAIDYLATPPNPAGDAVREALDWFSEQHRLSLEHYSPMYGDDDDESVEWRVHRESGSINDREWEIVGRGETALAAIQSARAALSASFEVSEPVAGEIGGEGEKPPFGVCDGVEQDAFEAWAQARGMNIETHPIHWLFLHGDTAAARLGWKAAIEHCLSRLTPPNPTNGDVQEALVEVDSLLKRISDWINSTLPVPTSGATRRMMEIKYVRDNLATLAKHGGAEG